MRTSRTTLVPDHRADAVPAAVSATPRFGFVILWSKTESHRLGETALLEPEPDADPRIEPTFFLGRALGHAGATPLWFGQHRPGSVRLPGALLSPGISRVQWTVRATERGVAIDNVGQRGLLIRNQMVLRGHAEPGDLVEIAGELLLMVVRRAPLPIPVYLPPSAAAFDFGAPDHFGIVGESPAAWELRRQLAFAAGREDHVLLTGPSGSGKELAARTIHGLSRRAAQRMVARNAATLPESLIDAELFGNPRDYPNPGMPERPGLIGAADGSTLFLDEIGELSHALQAHLLRVVESGEYQRLGEARARFADVRVVAATNRDALALKHDLLGRMRLRVALPGLELRREDIPLLARHMLRTMATVDPLVAERVFPDGDPAQDPCWSPGLVEALTMAPYATHVRELHTRLWEAIGHGDGTGLSSNLGTASSTGVPEEIATIDTVDPLTVSAEAVRAALEANDGSRDRTWRQLGLRSRHQLVRLMRRHGLNGAPAAPDRAAG